MKTIHGQHSTLTETGMQVDYTQCVSSLPDGTAMLTNMDGIGQRMRECREAMRLTQDEVAKRIGVTRGAISQLENGLTHTMAWPHLKAAAQYFRVEVEWLADGTGPKHPRAPMTQFSPEAVLLADQIDRLDPQQREILAAMIRQMSK